MVEDFSEFEGLPEVIEPDATMRFERETEFSHELEARIVYRMCTTALGQETRRGFLEVKSDKYGNILREWKSDTREIVINSVHTLKNVMINEILNDKETKLRIKKIFAKIKQLEEQAKKDEEVWYKSHPIQIRVKFQHQDGYLNQDFIFYQNLMNEKVKEFRKMFEAIERLMLKVHYLKKKMIIA